MPYIDIASPHQGLLAELAARYPDYAGPVAVVSVEAQTLYLYQQGALTHAYPVSTSRYGVGNREHSLQTPLGVHAVKTKLGGEAPRGTIFKARVNTGEIAELVQEPRVTDKDYVTTRILWLEGLEPGVNQGEGIDSYRRYIYIHGTHEEGLIGQPASKGCVRMYNRDVMELFQALPVGALVVIVA